MFCVLTALTNFIPIISIPCAGLHYNIQPGRQVKNIPHSGNPFSEHNVKFRFFKGRGNFILYHFHPGTISDYFSPLFQSFNPSHIQTHGRIEFQRPPARSGFRVSEHYSHLLTELIDKNNRAIGFAYHCGEFTQRLGHQTCLQPHMAVSHIPFNLSFGNQCSHRVHHHNVNGAGANHGFRNFQCLFTVIRLRNVQIIYVYSDIFCIHRVQCMFCVNKTCNASLFLHFGYHMQCNCGLTTGFRTIDLYDSPFGDSSQSQCNIKAQRPCREGLHIHLRGRISQLHYRSFSILLLNVAKRRIQCF